MDGFKQLLDPDLREALEDAERDQAELVQQQEERLQRGKVLTRADELIAILMTFEVQLTEARVHREQARRQRVVHDDGYDRQLLATEAAVMDLCSQLLDLELAAGQLPDAEEVLARLNRGLAAVRDDRNSAIEQGWAYRREKKMIAMREIAWERSVKQAARRLRRA
jgi:hypothetical protein